MGMRAKAVGALVGLAVLVVVGVSAASAKTAPKRKEGDDADPDPGEVLPVDVVMPGPNGEAGEGPEVRIDIEPITEVFPDPDPEPEPLPGQPEPISPPPPSAAPATFWLPANWMAEFVVKPDQGVSSNVLKSQIEGSVPDVTALQMQPDKVTFVSSDNESATISANHFRPYGVAGTIVSVRLISDGASEPVPLTPVAPPPAAAPRPSAPPPVVVEEPLTEEVSAVVEEITQGQETTPLIEAETNQDADPHGTIKLARLMLARENLPGWKSDLLEDIGDWQEKVGLKKDQKFGPVGLERMAEEVGILPLVRYYPGTVFTAAQAKALANEKVAGVIKKLEEFRPMSDQHIEALRASMAREKGQTMGTSSPAPQPTLTWVSEVTERIGQRAEVSAEKEIV